MKKYEELSTPAILGISAGFAVVGLLTYALVAPVAPAKLIALAHSAINQTITR
jgi:hypothetical protein